MPLSDFVHSHVRAFRAFLDSDSPGPLFVRAAAEAELLAMRLVAALQDDALADEVFFAHSAAFESSHAFYAECSEVVRQGLAAERAGLAAQDVMLPQLPRFEAPTQSEDGFHVERAFAEFAERCARGLEPWCKRLVFVLHTEPGSKNAEFIASLSELGRVSASCVKYIVLISPDVQLPGQSAAISQVEASSVEAGKRESGKPLVRDVALDARVLETGLRDRLARTDLPAPERVQLLGALAGLHSTRGEHEAALALREEQLALCERAGDLRGTLIAWLGIGDGFYAAQHWLNAACAHTTALELALDQGDGALVAQALLRLGHAQLRAEQLAEAIASYQAAADWHDRLGQPIWTTYALTWLGEAQRRRGSPAAAAAIWLQARARASLLQAELNSDVGLSELDERLARLEAARTQAPPQPQAFVPEQP